MALGGHFELKKRMFRSGETLGLSTGNKGGNNEHFLKFSALYYFFPFQNLKFLDYNEKLHISCALSWPSGGHFVCLVTTIVTG